MANLISRATGNWLTAGTWGLVDTTSLLISQASFATLPTSPGSTARSSAFTPGAITIDGIAVKLDDRQGSTGTLTVELWNNTGSAVVTGTTVTINVSDLPPAVNAVNNGGWILFEFASVLLVVATDYMVQCTTSSANQVRFFTNATTNNWTRMLRTTTTQAPAAGDDMLVAGGWTGAGAHSSNTVTMNSTAATDYGSGVADGSSITPALGVSNFGTLTFGTSAATNYILRLSGNMANWMNGTINVGTVGTPMPRDSTAVVEFDCAADADFGWHNHGGTCNIQGLSRTSGKNVVSCKLNTDEAVAQTVLGVDTDTGWLSGDQIAIASTSRTASEWEMRTLSANANASDMTVTAGLTNAHSGTSPTQAEVVLMTRNVKIRSVSTTAMCFVHNDNTAVVDIDWAEFSYMGKDTVQDWRGVSVTTTTGSFNMQFSSLHDFEEQGLYLAGATMNHLTVQFNVLVKLAQTVGHGLTLGIAAVGNDVVINGNIVMGSGFLGSISLGSLDITFTNNTSTSSPAAGAFYFRNDAQYGTLSGNVYHSNANNGLVLNTSGHTGVATNYKIWRNGLVGMVYSAPNGVMFDIMEIFGNGTANVTHAYASQAVGGTIRFRNWTLNGDTSFSTPTGFGWQIGGGNVAGVAIFDNCNFGTVGGIKTAHTQDIDHIGATGQHNCQIILRNTILASSIDVNNQSRLNISGFVSSQRHGQTAGNHKTWLKNGTLSTDTTIFNAASPSMRMTPTSATIKLESAALFQGVKVAVNNGGTVTISVYTRRSSAGDGAAYNGAQPRLIVKANPALGSNFNSDTVLDTHTAADGTWEQLTGTTAAVTDAGAVECVVDCSGTVGWINVDDFSVS